MPQTVDRTRGRSGLEEVEAVGHRLAPHFARIEARQRACDYLRGLLSAAERKKGRQLAEVAGNTTPYGLQHLLGRANWDADAVRDELRDYVREHLDDENALLIIDETGVLKKGDKSVGGKRQSSGTAGKTEHCQVGAFLAYASKRGHGVIDREVYLPDEWTADAARRERASVPEVVRFATKPELAQEMLGRAVAAGVKAAWVVADAVYGDRRRLGMLLEDEEQPYVLALSGKAYVWAGFEHQRMSMVLESLRQAPVPARETAAGWRRLSAGEGAKGPRLYDWLRLPLTSPVQEGVERGLLVRRSSTEPDGLTAYTVFAPEGTTRTALARVAGSRWRVEIGFEEATGEVGLAHYEVRSWHGWYRLITLALFAHAFLTVIRSDGQDIEVLKKGAPELEARDSLWAFKTQRGLSSRRRSPQCARSCGAWSWADDHCGGTTSSGGRAGAVPIRPSPGAATIRGELSPSYDVHL